MIHEIKHTLIAYKSTNISLEQAANEILSLKAENETDVSASLPSHDRLHDVVKSECVTDATDEGICEDVGGTLSNRTFDKSKCDFYADELKFIGQYCNCKHLECKLLANRFANQNSGTQ